MDSPNSQAARIRSEDRKKKVLDGILNIINEEKERGNDRVPLPKNLIRRRCKVDPRTLGYDTLKPKLEERQNEVYGRIAYPIYLVETERGSDREKLLIADPEKIVPTYAVPLQPLELLRERWLENGGEIIDPLEDVREVIHIVGKELDSNLRDVYRVVHDAGRNVRT